VSGYCCVFFLYLRFQTFDGIAYEQQKMHLGFKHCIHSAKPFLSDKPKLFLVFYVVSVSKCKLGFTITVFGLLSGHVNARKNFTFAQTERQKRITSVKKKYALNDIIEAYVYNENFTGRCGR
jgi:hypothetical protein